MQDKTMSDYNAGVEAAAARFDRLAEEAEKLIEISLPGFHVQEAHGRALTLRLHAAGIRKLKKTM
jgi:hypothetical protein